MKRISKKCLFLFLFFSMNIFADDVQTSSIKSSRDALFINLSAATAQYNSGTMSKADYLNAVLEINKQAEAHDNISATQVGCAANYISLNGSCIPRPGVVPGQAPASCPSKNGVQYIFDQNGKCIPPDQAQATCASKNGVKYVFDYTGSCQPKGVPITCKSDDVMINGTCRPKGVPITCKSDDVMINGTCRSKGVPVTCRSDYVMINGTCRPKAVPMACPNDLVLTNSGCMPRAVPAQ